MIATELVRIIFTCRTCKHAWAHDYQREGKSLVRRPTPKPEDVNQHPFSTAEWDGKFCPACRSGNVKSSQVIGTVTSKPCNERCMDATNHVCNCSCGGANHGKSFLV